ncbi:hypothetical protein BDV19DRAFT_37950 [Aspergillus venezuelensis]
MLDHQAPAGSSSQKPPQSRRTRKTPERPRIPTPKNKPELLRPPHPRRTRILHATLSGLPRIPTEIISNNWWVPHSPVMGS